MTDQPERKEMGKVARLPKAVRDQVNGWLVNGETLIAICGHLNDAGHPGFNEQNISNWRVGGHQNWLRTQRLTDDIRARSQASLEMVRALKEEGGGITEANELILASHISEILSEFDPATLKATLAENPEKLIELARVVTGQSASRAKLAELELKVRRFEEAATAAKAKLEVVKAAGGLTPETLARIEEAAGLL